MYLGGMSMTEECYLKLIGKQSMSIADAMTMIDINAAGILFLVDSDDVLSGCVSDGDIRRWILKTGDIKACVEKAMTFDPCFVYNYQMSEAMTVIKEKHITALPIVNSKKQIVDIVLSAELSERISVQNKNELMGVPVVVMAGGKGTRLYPFTKILPKPLIPIGETPIVERIMDRFVEYGIDKFYITVNYKKSMIKSYFSDMNPSYEIDYIEETVPLGTGGSIKLIPDKFDKPLFVTNCDTLIIADYADIYKHHIEAGNSITVVSALKNITVPYGVIHSGENGEIQNMEEKPKLSYFVNTGMYIINPETIEMIPDNRVFHMTHLIDEVMKFGGKVGTYPISEDSFLDMGEFSEMKRMEEKLHIVSEE